MLKRTMQVSLLSLVLAFPLSSAFSQSANDWKDAAKDVLMGILRDQTGFDLTGFPWENKKTKVNLRLFTTANLRGSRFRTYVKYAAFAGRSRVAVAVDCNGPNLRKFTHTARRGKEDFCAQMCDRDRRCGGFSYSHVVDRRIGVCFLKTKATALNCLRGRNIDLNQRHLWGFSYKFSVYLQSAKGKARFQKALRKRQQARPRPRPRPRAAVAAGYPRSHRVCLRFPSARHRGRCAFTAKRARDWRVANCFDGFWGCYANNRWIHYRRDWRKRDKNHGGGTRQSDLCRNPTNPYPGQRCR